MNSLPVEYDGAIDTLFINANLATMAGREPYGRMHEAALAVSRGKIVWLGESKGLPPALLSAAKTVEDVDGHWITPGLIDCHTHIVWGGTRADEFEKRLTGVSYAQIAREGGGILSTVKATRKASPDDLFSDASRRLASLMTEGVTTVEIKSGYGLDLNTEVKMLEVAHRLGVELEADVVPTFLGAHALPPEYKGRSDDYIDFICREVLPVVAKKNLAEFVDAFCETIGFTADQTHRVFTAAGRLGLGVKLHAEQLSDQGGAELAARFGACSADHLEYLSEKGARAMAAAGTVAVLLPGAFYYLGETRKPPVDRIRELRIPIAISTDCNPGSSPVGSILTIMNMACTLLDLTPEEALAGVTRHAAKALGIGDSKGTLSVGKQADLAVWDIASPAELAYGVGFNPCLGVIYRGKKVMSRSATGV
ncbi:MAG: imidazolonepropionase [Desulfobacteraceae bacterium]|nr:imidazolonepropionase [Desulfobacteraceae bacterium]